MKIINVIQNSKSFDITWEDCSHTETPFIWLRDNDINERHPLTHERVFDLLSVELDIQPNRYDFDAEQLQITWPNKDTISIYSAQWLYLHRPGHRLPDPAKIDKLSWLDGNISSLPRHDGQACKQDQKALLCALQSLKSTGIILVENLENDPAAGEAFGDLIGFKRESNYGVVFEVKSKPNPNNLAYTSLALPLHTDLANQEFIPGNQFLHCYKNTATGGGSQFADALTIVNKFRDECPNHYQLLCELQLPWHFIDEVTDLRQHRPVISLNRDGSFRGLTFNAHLAYTPDFSAELLYDFYAAFRNLMERIRHSPHNIEYTLKPTEMVVFDNQRILHGRASFNTNSGERHLRGYYIEHNEIENRIRMLTKSVNQEQTLTNCTTTN